MYHTYNKEKFTIIKRSNRTLNQKLKIYFETRDNFKWHNILPNITKKYNIQNVHRIIRMTLIEVGKNNEKEILLKPNKTKS